MEQPINVSKWLKENESSFVPPVCNKLIYSKQLKVFFVGGPNQRTDFHIEQGEEFFYMLKGDMHLKVVERGLPKTIHIQEGEAFLLPARIPHSPQRHSNTIGLVVERERIPELELDGLRYYVPNSKQILYERWFYCSDLGTQLAPMIKEFFDSNECHTGIPSANSRLVPPPYPDDSETRTIDPINLTKWLQCYKKEIEIWGLKALFDECQFATKIKVYGGEFKHLIENDDHETFLWQMANSAQIEINNGQEMSLKNGSSVIVPPYNKIWLKTHSSGYTLVVSMPPGKRQIQNTN